MARRKEFNEFGELNCPEPHWIPSLAEIAEQTREIRTRNAAAMLDRNAPVAFDTTKRDRRRRHKKAYQAAYQAKKRLEKKLKQRQ